MLTGIVIDICTLYSVPALFWRLKVEYEYHQNYNLVFKESTIIKYIMMYRLLITNFLQFF